MNQLGYDPSSNPRSLEVVPDPDHQSRTQNAIVKTSLELGRYDALKGMFGSKGWEMLKKELTDELARTLQALADPKTDARTLPFVQGQIAALRRFLTFPEIFETKRSVLRKRLADLNAELEEA